MHLLVQILVILLSALAMASESDLTVALDSDRLRLVFQVSDGKVFLGSVNTGNRYESLSDPSPGSSIWQVAIENSDGKTKKRLQAEILSFLVRERC